MRGSLSRAIAVATMVGCGGDAFTGGSTNDGGASEASPSQDGGQPEASAMDGAAEGAPAHWCDGRKDTFCDDFDESADLASHIARVWTTSSMTGGTLAFIGPNVPSPPNALSVHASNNANVLLVKEFPTIGRPTRARLEFELRILSPGSVGPLAAAAFAAIGLGATSSDGVVAMAIGNGPSLAALWVAPSDAGVPADAGAFNAAGSRNPFPALNTWVGRYAIEVTYSPGAVGQTACAQIYGNGTALLSQCLSLPPSLANPRLLSIALGEVAGGLGPTGNVDVAFDNVTFSIQ